MLENIYCRNRQITGPGWIGMRVYTVRYIQVNRYESIYGTLYTLYTVPNISMFNRRIFNVCSTSEQISCRYVWIYVWDVLLLYLQTLPTVFTTTFMMTALLAGNNAATGLLSLFNRWGCARNIVHHRYCISLWQDNKAKNDQNGSASYTSIDSIYRELYIRLRTEYD